MRRWTRGTTALFGLLVTALTAAAFTASPALAEGPAGTGRWLGSSRVVVTDQATRTVMVLDPEEALHYRPGAPDRNGLRWSWSADGSPELTDLDPRRTWKNPSEAKTRIWHGRRYLLAGASGGLAAVVRYPDGHVYWAADVGSGNVHSIELLPDGNVAVAASTPGVVRLYAASSGPRSTVYTEFPLPGAHGVHFDPATGWLWALGTRHLVALVLSGPPDAPRLAAVRTVALPSAGGHDLDPVHARPGRLWVTTTHGVYQYSLTRKAFLPFPGQARISRRNIKSIGDDPATGQVLTVAPQPGNPCAWCTTVLTYYDPDGTRVLANSQIYKARWWTTLRR